jgi:inward rectifier potassium channel
MARFSINPFSRVNNDTGFGASANYGGRFVNRDGTFNIRREGMGFWNRYSLFQSMLNLPMWQFILVIVVFYMGVNILFTGIYVWLGADQFTGINAANTWEEMKEIYFFSTQTFTTVGYGRVNPTGTAASFVASIEAMSGLLSFAIATGLIYGRFAKAKSYLIFSDHAVIAPYRGGKALMFRFASYKERHTLTDVDIRVNVAFKVASNGKEEYKFFDLSLERSKVDSLPMNWTVVHPIDEKSPLANFGEEEMRIADMEVYVLVRGFDDVYSSYVNQRTSYTFEEIKANKKFTPMYRESEDGKTTILEIQKLNDHVTVES